MGRQSISRKSFLRISAFAGAFLLAGGAKEALAPDMEDIPILDSQDAAALPRRRKPPGKRVARKTLEVLDTDGVVSRLGILSDTHLCTYDTAAIDKLSLALRTLGWMAPQMDSLFMLGDVTLNGYIEEMDLFATTTSQSLFENFSSVPTMHLLMGNHDYWSCSLDRFESFFGSHGTSACFSSKQNSITNVPGATIIKLNGTGSILVDEMDYTGSYEFLAQALDETATNRPDDAILVMAHEPPHNMKLPQSIECGNFGQGTALDLVELMAQYPQTRMFSGHIHNPLSLPETVNTDLGFTSIHTSTVGSCLFIRGEKVDREETGSQGLVLDIREDGSLLLHCLDFTHQEYIGEPHSI